MCSASKAVNRHEVARQGVVYALGHVNADFGCFKPFGALYAVGTKPESCIFCVETGQKLTLSGISKKQRDCYLLEDGDIVVTFFESEHFGRDDIILLPNGISIPFRALASPEVRVFVGEKDKAEYADDATLRAVEAAVIEQSMREGGIPGLIVG